MAKLVVLSEGLTGNTYELKVDKTTIGRLEDNAFQIAEPSVSSHHCEILLRGNEIIVKDLNSTNGTFINGEKISEGALKHGQILRLGSIDIRLETAPAAPPGKIPLGQTRVIQGVKLNELEQGSKPVFGKDASFAKKSNKTAIVFITVGIILGVVIAISIFFALQGLSNQGPR
jgi:pSer/pThr/pTyr-binding forkhead associated (FHA) protein